MTHLLRNSVQIHNDGSKLNGASGSRIFSLSVGIAEFISLSDHCSVCQVEVVAMLYASGIIWDGRVSILSDSQSAIKTLSSNVTNSKTVYGCRRYINEIAERYDIHIVWVPGHSGIPGNCWADELVRRVMTIELSDEFSNLDIPMTSCKLIIDNAIVNSVNDMWANSDKIDRTTR